MEARTLLSLKVRANNSKLVNKFGQNDVIGNKQGFIANLAIMTNFKKLKYSANVMHVTNILLEKNML